MSSKSQDLLVALKMVSSGRKPYAEMAKELGMSVGEVFAATKRAADAGLIDPKSKKCRASALKEFLIHGVKYAFPVHRGSIVRGIPTSWAAAPLREQLHLDPKDPVPVWRDPHGTSRGYQIEPLFKSAPYAAQRDPDLYELLALVDALREGKARERALASEALEKKLDALLK
jgi:DNA-binding Lrp family transcriptional regulator